MCVADSYTSRLALLSMYGALLGMYGALLGVSMALSSVD